VEDRGFQFGDGVYEVLRTYDGHIFHLDDHIRRLYDSARLIQMEPRETPDQIKKIIRAGCTKSGYKNVKIYIQVTRGIAPRLHPFPKGVRPTSVYTFRRLDPVSQAILDRGVSVISIDDIRWNRCHVKSLNLLPNILAREKALQSGAYEALFVRDGLVWEGAGSNFFAVYGQKVVTPPKGAFLLSGITRDRVLTLGRNKKIIMREGTIPLPDLYKADEIFLTGTTVEILPVVRVDKRRIGTGKPGAVTQRLRNAFEEEIRRLA
jgi:D-alanine transaminase